MKNTIQWKKPFRLLIFFLLFPCWAFAQSITVSGTIKDPTGETLIGVNVIETGTTRGTISDIDGNYQISVAPDAKLTFSYIGFESQTVDVRGRTSINITLKEDINTLDEVVVVGYGTMRKSDLTGSVSSVSTDAITRAAPTSIDQVLQGRAAGVQIQQSSGMPGAGSNIRIRGTGSINSSNEPIYVIDGVIISQDANNMNSNVMASINPSDIVSIDILKDASATAIYGSRASNGVIIITTRRGEAGSAVINFNTNIGLQELPKRLDMLNLSQYAQHRNDMIAAGNPNVRKNNSFVRPDLLGKGTDWQNELFRTAMMQNYNLSISGGSEKSTYNVAAGYLNQEGIAIGSGFERYNLTGNFDANVKPWVKTGLNMAFSNTFQELTVDDQSLINKALQTTPDVPVRNPDGSFGATDAEFAQVNPIALATFKDNNQEMFGLRGNAYLELQPIGIFNDVLKGLKYRFELAVDYNMTQQDQFMPSYYLSQTQFEESNSSEKSKKFNKYWTYRNILNYDKTINRIHKLNVMLGQEYSTSSWSSLSGKASDSPTNTANGLRLGIDPQLPFGGNYSGQNALSSQFGRIFYSLKDIYMLTATLRHDGTSKFAPENRWGWFPSAAFAWRISGYNFLKDNESISNLKLRLGWGLVGNQGIPDETAWFAVYSTAASPWGAGLYPSNTPNPNLKWETTNSTNIGIDLGLFNNRIDLIVDWYNRQTDDLLMITSLPDYLGVSSAELNTQGGSSAPWGNLGSLRNRGIEITVNTQNVITQDFRWSSSLIFSSNKNKVMKLNTETGVFYGSTSDNNYGGGGSTITNRTIVGEPIGQIFGYKVRGRFENASDFYMYNKDGELVRTPVTADAAGNMREISENGIWIGDYMYEDVNGDGIISEADRVVIGNPEPKFTYGIGNTFTYKNWDLTVMFSGVYGNDVVNYSRRHLSSPYRNISNLYTEALDYAQLGLINPELPNDYRNVQIVGGDPKQPRMPLSSVTNEHNFQFSDRFIEDGSYLRLQNISLAYSFPKKWMNSIGLTQCKLSFNMQNVYTWTKYKGYDPEIGTTATQEGQNRTFGIDNSRYPSPRTYTVGLNLTL